MTSYNLSSFAGAGAQFFDDNGVPLTGGKVFTYAAGTTTPLATYTTAAGTVANTNPIILDAAGRTPNEIWLAVGTLYKFIVKTSTDELIGTYDGLPPINDPYSINALLGSITGTNAIAAVATPAITAYAAGATYSFIAANTNTAATTISIDGLPVKSITKNGSATLTAGDIQAGKLTWIEYDGTTFQLLNNIIYGGSITNGTINSLTAPLSPASGGTGRSTLTANNVLLGNGVAAVQQVAPGAAGNVLASNGTTWVSSPGSGRLLRAPQILTSGTSYTTPASCTTIYVELVGGGGGGAGANNTAGSGGGGGSGAYAAKYFTVAPATAYTYAIGAAGAAGTTTTSGGNGGSTTFAVDVTTVTGGGGTGGVYATATGGAGGAGGTATSGDINISGGSGGGGSSSSAATGPGGTGGASYFGGGGNSTMVGAPSAGLAYGSGGGGARSTNAGGAGAAGVIRIWEYS
jgi:hypothetical protein